MESQVRIESDADEHKYSHVDLFKALSHDTDALITLLDQFGYPENQGVMSDAVTKEQYRALTLYKLRGADPLIELSDDDRQNMSVAVALAMDSIHDSYYDYMIKFLAGLLNVKTVDVMGKFIAGELTDSDLVFVLRRIQAEHDEAVERVELHKREEDEDEDEDGGDEGLDKNEEDDD